MTRARKFVLSFKLEVIRKYDQCKSYRAVAKAYKLDRNMVRSWVRNLKIIDEAVDLFRQNRISPRREVFRFLSND